MAKAWFLPRVLRPEAAMATLLLAVMLTGCAPGSSSHRGKLPAELAKAPAKEPAKEPAKAPPQAHPADATPSGATASGPVPSNPATPPAPQAPTQPSELDLLLRQDDRILFIGDEVTQQMQYTRAVAAALLAVRPNLNLRIYNGGKDGATAASALKWTDELLDLTQPSIVVICLGLNDAQPLALAVDHAQTLPKPRPVEVIEQEYREALRALVEKVRKREGVRSVLVLSPPAVQAGAEDPLTGVGLNQTLYRLSKVAQDVALEAKVGYTDMYEHMHKVYAAAARAGGRPLTRGDRLPSEEGQIVLASVVLYGMGMPAAELDRVGWSPLGPKQMLRIRQAMPVQTQAVGLERADVSRALYQGFRRHDELFFQAWRLAGRHGGVQARAKLLAQAELAWLEAQAMAQRSYKNP